MSDMFRTNIQNNNNLGAPVDTGIIVGIPLYSLTDSTMAIYYYFWVMNNSSASKTLTIYGCDTTTDCTTLANYSISIGTIANFATKTREIAKLKMQKASSAGQVSLTLGSGV